MRRDEKLALLKAKYDENRLSLFAYAAVCVGDDCVGAVAGAFLAASRRFGALQGAADPNYFLLRLLDKAVKKAAPGKSSPVFAALDGDSRRAWTLRHICGLSTSQTAKLLGVPRETAAALASPDAAPDVNTVKAQIQALAASADAWGHIEYMLDRSVVRARRVAGICIGTFAAIALALLAREGYAAVKILGVSREMTQTDVLTASTDASQHWTAREYAAADGLSMDRTLYATLSALDPDTPVRLDFTYYDAELAASIVTDGGQSLYDVYEELYETSSLLSSAYSICCSAVNRFYRGYEFDVTRSPVYGYVSGFEPQYGSYYEALGDITGGRNAAVWERLLAAYPGIFGSEESFDGFLFSRRFINTCPAMYNILSGEYLHRQWLAGQYEYEDGQDPVLAYEMAIFAYYNVYGGQYRYGYALTYPDDITQFQSDTRALGVRLADALYAAVADCGLTELESEMYDRCDCSYFSAQTTAGRAIELATDGRFTFKGLAYPDAPAGSPEGLERRLALALATGGGKRYTVYLVDDEYRSLSYNYVIPVKLPEAFRAEMREYMAGSHGGTLAFESDIGYNYLVYYGHETAAGRYGILRALFLHPDARVMLREGTSFIRLLPL